MLVPNRGQADVAVGRSEALSDGVFAIIITLLVLEIRVPELPEELVATQLAGALAALFPKILSYIMSFMMIGIYWMAHHNLFHLLRQPDRTFLWLNLLFLMCLAFIPFPTALIGEYSRSQVAVTFYGGVLLATAVSFMLMWQYLLRHPSMIREDVEPGIIKIMTKDYVVGLSVYGFAFLVSFFAPDISIFFYIAIAVTFIFFNSRRLVRNH